MRQPLPPSCARPARSHAAQYYDARFLRAGQPGPRSQLKAWRCTDWLASFSHTQCDAGGRLRAYSRPPCGTPAPRTQGGHASEACGQGREQAAWSPRSRRGLRAPPSCRPRLWSSAASSQPTHPPDLEARAGKVCVNAPLSFFSREYFQNLQTKHEGRTQDDELRYAPRRVTWGGER